MKLLLYFSATGNTYSIANKISESLDSSTVDNILNYKKYDFDLFDELFFVFPVHYNHIPSIFLDILKCLRIKESTKIYAIATYSANTGYVFEEVQEIFKNNKIIDLRIKMPGNYILEYGAFPQWLQKYLLKNIDKQISNILKLVTNDVDCREIKANIISKIYAKRSKYKINEFHEVGKGFFANGDCIGCKRCEKICCVKTITMIDDKPIWNDTCIQCMACIQNCPENAIRHKLLKKERKRYLYPDVDVTKLGRWNVDY